MYKPFVRLDEASSPREPGSTAGAPLFPAEVETTSAWPQPAEIARPRNEPTRLLELDVLRGISVLMVMLHHTALYPQVHSPLYWPLVVLNRVGWSGVDIFFVLSGYLVGGLLLREFEKTGAMRPGRFWVRRAFKVWPTYFAFLAAYFTYHTIIGRPHLTAVRTLLGNVWPNLLHIQNYFSSTSDLGWLWSLAVEEHFYLVLPWALALAFATRAGRSTEALPVRRRMVAIFLFLTLSCLALRAITLTHANPEDPYAVAFPTHLRMDSLFCGVFVAYLVRFHDGAVQRLRPYRWALLLVSLSVWIPFEVDSPGHLEQLRLYPFGFTLLAWGSAGLVLFAHLASTAPTSRASFARHLLLVPPMRLLSWLGVRSYAIYVWHGVFAKPIAHRVVLALGVTGDMPGFRGWLHDLTYLATYALLGAAMYRFVELPGLRLRQRIAPPIVPTAAP